MRRSAVGVRYSRLHPVWSAVIAIGLVLAIGLIVVPMLNVFWIVVLIWLLCAAVLGFVVQQKWAVLLPFIPPPFVSVYSRLTEADHGEVDTALFILELFIFTMMAGTAGIVGIAIGRGVRQVIDVVWGTRPG